MNILKKIFRKILYESSYTKFKSSRDQKNALLTLKKYFYFINKQ